MTKNSVLVTGAAGFVGRNVCRAFSSLGYQVHGVGHGDWMPEEWQSWGISRWVAADISINSLEETAAKAEFDAIIHCAGGGAVSYSYANPFEDYHRSVSSTVTLLEFARSSLASKPRIVLASSAAVYGDQGDVDLMESATCSPLSPYGYHKFVAENLCNSYSRFFGIQTSIVRLFSVYGEGLRKQLLWDALNKFSRDENTFFGSGNELRDWIHVDDAVKLLCLAAVTPQNSFEIYNGGHIKTTTCDVLNQLANEVGLNNELVFNGETHTGNPYRLTADYGLAQQKLGWQPTVELNEGIARYVKWFKNEGKQ
jgi:UDP-glucose 4-epimerase